MNTLTDQLDKKSKKGLGERLGLNSFSGIFKAAFVPSSYLRFAKEIIKEGPISKQEKIFIYGFMACVEFSRLVLYAMPSYAIYRYVTQ